jgi:hypothetical protein
MQAVLKQDKLWANACVNHADLMRLTARQRWPRTLLGKWPVN